MKEAQHQAIINVRCEIWERTKTGKLKERKKDCSQVITLIGKDYEDCNQQLETFLQKIQPKENNNEKNND